MAIRPASIMKILVVISLLLAIGGGIAHYLVYNMPPNVDRRVASFLLRLDPDEDPSLAAWFSSVALLAAAVLTALIGLQKRRRHQPFAAHWLGLAGLFVLLSIDESIEIHEMLSHTLQVAMNTGGFLFHAWIIPGAIFVVLLAVVYCRFLWALEQRTRRLFILSGIIFVAGALGMEAVSAPLWQQNAEHTLAYTLVVSVEELLEMLGVVLFIYALLDYARTHLGRIYLRVAAD